MADVFPHLRPGCYLTNTGAGRLDEEGTVSGYGVCHAGSLMQLLGEQQVKKKSSRDDGAQERHYEVNSGSYASGLATRALTLWMNYEPLVLKLRLVHLVKCAYCAPTLGHC